MAGGVPDAGAQGLDDIDVLKGVLPLMSRHAAGYSPVSYTVWYEYARGRAIELKREVQEKLQKTERLTAAQTYALYVKYLVGPAERTVMEARAGMLSMVQDIRRTVSQADGKSAEFDARLSAFERDLSDVDFDAGDVAAAVAGLKSRVAHMIEDTRRAAEGFATISGDLHASLETISRLEGELRGAREAAQIDALTGLLNRRGFDNELARFATGEGRDAGFSALMLDIDHFKVVNDTYGHPLGDVVISAVARAIGDCLGARGMAARYGGEEFAVLLPDMPLEAARDLAERIRARVEQGKIKRRKDDHAIGGISISAGVAERGPREEAADVVERADAALYAAKRAGRNRVELAQPPGRP